MSKKGKKLTTEIDNIRNENKDINRYPTNMFFKKKILLRKFMPKNLTISMSYKKSLTNTIY